MKSLFDPANRDEIVTRLTSLDTTAQRQWGTMTPPQMMAHCSNVLETAVGISPRRQTLFGKIFAPFVRKLAVGEKPFSRNSPTDPAFVISDDRDLDAERKRLLGLIDLFVQRGPEEAGRATHAFFGRLTGEEWGRLSYKHLDHHLRQFGV